MMELCKKASVMEKEYSLIVREIFGYVENLKIINALMLKNKVKDILKNILVCGIKKLQFFIYLIINFKN
jgi:hypothetical protein